MTGSTDETGKNMDGQKHGERQFAKSFAAASFFAHTFFCPIPLPNFRYSVGFLRCLTIRRYDNSILPIPLFALWTTLQLETLPTSHLRISNSLKSTLFATVSTRS
jgi:hypothetical protein